LPIASKMVKTRPSLRLFSLSRREQVGSTQGADCFACAGGGGAVIRLEGDRCFGGRRTSGSVFR
jgi:hypothetical protein